MKGLWKHFQDCITWLSAVGNISLATTSAKRQTRMPLALCRALSCIHRHMFEVQHAVFQKIFQSSNSNLWLFHDIVTRGGHTGFFLRGLHRSLSGWLNFCRGHTGFFLRGSHRSLSQGVIQVSFSGGSHRFRTFSHGFLSQGVTQVSCSDTGFFLRVVQLLQGSFRLLSLGSHRFSVKMGAGVSHRFLSQGSPTFPWCIEPHFPWCRETGWGGHTGFFLRAAQISMM